MFNSRLFFRARRAARLPVHVKYGDESLAHRPIRVQADRDRGSRCIGKRCAVQAKSTECVSKSWGSSGRGVTGHTVDFCVIGKRSEEQKQKLDEDLEG